MDEQRIREMVAKAIEFSDGLDKDAMSPTVSAQSAREWTRLTSLITSLAMSLDEIAPGVARDLQNFQLRVAAGQNPLLDAADNKEQKS
jgi:hypothetical protein